MEHEGSESCPTDGKSGIHAVGAGIDLQEEQGLHRDEEFAGPDNSRPDVVLLRVCNSIWDKQPGN